MKIIHISTNNYLGGAAIAAARLNKALNQHNIESSMIVQTVKEVDLGITTLNLSHMDFWASIRRYRDSLLFWDKPKSTFSVARVQSNKLIKKINRSQADIVHLHWINHGMLKIEDLKKIKAPIVWTLHDAWPFTGGCHVTGNCLRYENNCGNCPILDSQRSNDLSRKVLNRKNKTYKCINKLTIVGVSNWISQCSKNSYLLGGFRHETIPNCIDTKVFKKLNKRFCRELWNLPINKKLLLFGSVNSTSDPNKGYNELVTALNKLDRQKIDDIELVVFGATKINKLPLIPFKVTYLGSLTDQASLVTLYNSVDVTLVPSKFESFGLTACESIACGTPVVAFKTSGLMDIIEHKMDGFLAEPGNTDDFKDGIQWVLGYYDYEKLQRNAVENAKQKFDFDVVADRYLNLYQSILFKK